MSTDYRALCAELLSLLDGLAMRDPEMDGGLLRRRARAALAQPEPEGVTDERITSIAKAVQECALAWEPNARLLGNVCAEDIADLCSAVLARWGTPANNTRGTH